MPAPEPEVTDPDTSETSSDRYAVPALERGLLLLCEFSRTDRTLTAPELARRLSIPRSTVFRLLTTLERMGFVRKVESGTAYRLDMAVLRLGFEYLASLELTELGGPLLERLRDATGLPSNLVVRDGQSVVVVAKSSAPTPFVSSVYVGTRLPAHSTSLGRALLCDLTLDELRALYPQASLEGYTPRTPATVDALYEMLQQDAARGYVQDTGFFEAAIASVVAPVRDHSGRVAAAIGVTIAAAQIENGNLDQDAVVAAVRQSAAELSRLLDYVPGRVAG
ncbi:IclR family transcriptional regulator [Achromobacter kerstersii]|uniref:IclR family transcriptional regulator n=1 Tax=Achromobacter kerstersii TaxID=1353890 RepID=UPI003D04B76A